MNELYNVLPKDLVNYIILDYTKDRTNYGKVVEQFENIITYLLCDLRNIRVRLNPTTREDIWRDNEAIFDFLLNAVVSMYDIN